MYDASGVRLHAGKQVGNARTLCGHVAVGVLVPPPTLPPRCLQASVLNMIIMELPPDHPVSSSAGQLKDTLGHTPLQVAIGAVVGMVTGEWVAGCGAAVASAPSKGKGAGRWFNFAARPPWLQVTLLRFCTSERGAPPARTGPANLLLRTLFVWPPPRS